MTHQYENLNPEKFQEFCQALLVREFPKLQCFPVGQPDGGRDATAPFRNVLVGEFVVFQVKYVRNPQSLADPHKWLTEKIQEEAPKIKELVPKGAKEYYLLTNVCGTGHLEAGAIDQVKQILAQNLDIPSACWWRDDLDRRLENAWDLKWRYPELMTGPDLIRFVIESGLSEHKERRSSAIRAFLSTQYDLDEEVRFKQVELQNKLLELFIDVPIGFRAGDGRLYHVRQLIFQDVATQFPAIAEDAAWNSRAYAHQEPAYHRDLPPLGAATFLLHELGQMNVPRMVLEGAPGQGKSTIVQYVCQVHRMRLLYIRA